MAPRKKTQGKKAGKKAGSGNARKVIPMTKQQATIFLKRMEWRRRLQRRKEDRLGITPIIKNIKEKEEDKSIIFEGADFLQAKEKKRTKRKKSRNAPEEVFARLREKGKLSSPKTQRYILRIGIPSIIIYANETEAYYIRSFNALIDYINADIKIAGRKKGAKLFFDYLAYLRDCCLKHKDLTLQLIFRTLAKE